MPSLLTSIESNLEKIHERNNNNFNLERKWKQAVMIIIKTISDAEVPIFIQHLGEHFEFSENEIDMWFKHVAWKKTAHVVVRAIVKNKLGKKKLWEKIEALNDAFSLLLKDKDFFPNILVKAGFIPGDFIKDISI